MRFLTTQPEAERLSLFVIVEECPEVARVVSVEDTLCRSVLHRQLVILRSCRVVLCVVRSGTPTFARIPHVITVLHQHLRIECELRREMRKMVGSFLQLPRVFPRQDARSRRGTLRVLRISVCKHHSFRCQSTSIAGVLQFLPP